MDTLGGLTDSLFTNDMKLWKVQDEIHRYSKETPEEFAAHPHDELHDVFKRVTYHNLQRNRLMTQIDELHARDIARGKADVDPRPKVMPR